MLEFLFIRNTFIHVLTLAQIRRICEKDDHDCVKSCQHFIETTDYLMTEDLLFH